jgi:hypothetical protein
MLPATNWDLMDVRATKTVVLRITIEEHPPVEKSIRRRLNARNERPRAERSLLNIPVIILLAESDCYEFERYVKPYLRVAVENQFADLVHRELTARPNLGDIEGVERDRCRLLWSHNLDTHGPARVATPLNVVPHVALRVVRVFTTHEDVFLVRELLDTLLRTPVVLKPTELVSTGCDTIENPLLSRKRTLRPC